MIRYGVWILKKTKKIYKTKNIKKNVLYQFRGKP